MRNPVIGIFLSLCLLAPMLGMYGWLQQRRKTVRKEIKHRVIAGMDRSELVLLRFTPEQEAELKWEHSREFEFEGQMYDIVEKEIHDGVMHYWCWSDDEETTLNKQLLELTNMALGLDLQHQHQRQQFAQFLQHLFFEDGPLFVFAPNQNGNAISYTNTQVVRSWKSAPPSPPPQLA